MTAQKAGALKDDADKWGSIDWKQAWRQVKRLQVRIAKAVKESRWNKVKSLQYLLTRSFYAAYTREYLGWSVFALMTR